MTRYIDADKINAELMDEYHGMISDESMKIYKIMQMLDNAPTADVAKVVRCKDCKYYRDGHCGVLGFCEPDEFCSRGERRKDNAEVH